VREGFLSTSVRRYDLDAPARDRLIAGIAGILDADPRVRCGCVFGSLLEGRPFADIDVGVLLDPAVMPAAFLDTQFELCGALERATRIPVDVVILNDAPIGLRLAALRGRRIQARDEAECLAFMERTALQAMDTDYLRRQSLRDVLGVDR
jgi:hypothetical protein